MKEGRKKMMIPPVYAYIYLCSGGEGALGRLGEVYGIHSPDIRQVQAVIHADVRHRKFPAEVVVERRRR